MKRTALLLLWSASTSTSATRSSSAAFVPLNCKLTVYMEIYACRALVLNVSSTKLLVCNLSHQIQTFQYQNYFLAFEDDNAVYLVTEYIEGLAMRKLSQEDRKVAEKELEGHLETLRSLKSDV